MAAGAGDVNGYRVIAVDWSGAADRRTARQAIWLAEARDGVLVRLEGGRTRTELTDHLIELARESPRLVVGLDFAFSLPAWFLEERGLKAAPDLWSLAAEKCERWLAECEPPFWGRPGKGRPEGLPAHFRRTDRAVRAVSGIRPKSPFQIGGAGAVGTASLRGMPQLARLREEGFSIWPFDPPRPPLVIEIYPRLLTGAVVKSRKAARRSHLDGLAERLPEDLRGRAASSDDAFDAAVSALVMMDHLERILRVPLPEEHEDVALVRREGRIWRPSLAGENPPVKDGTTDHEHRSGVAAPLVRQSANPEPLEGAGAKRPSEDVSSRPVAPDETSTPSAAGLLRALSFAARKHRDQRRKGGEASPYINHPIEVARALAEDGGLSDLVTLQAALLHDTIEDTDTTSEELEREFGPEVRRVVEEVTDDKSIEDKAERKRRQAAAAPRLSDRAKLVRIGDKIANLRDISYAPPAKWSLARRREYVMWTQDVVEGCRGVNAALEARYDRELERALQVLDALEG